MVSAVQKDAILKLWQRGLIAGWYLRDDQLPAYKFLQRHRFPVFEAARRFGKTTIELNTAMEKLLQNEAWIWRWCEPWKYQAREIVIPEIDKIQDLIPHRERFKFYKTDSFYEQARTGSRLYLRGVNEDKGESARGSYAHGITADEKGSWKDPVYITNEVLLAQLLTTRGCLHSLSTPPRNLGHIWYTDKELAIQDGRFFQNIIHDNKSLSEEDIELMCRAVGGPSSPAWRREFLCEKVADPTLQIVPEYQASLVDIPSDYQHPEFFDAYTGGDSGLDDNTAILFGYYDFLKDWVVIEDEYVASGQTTETDIKAAKAKEAALWGTACICAEQPCFEHAKRPYRRVMDAQKKGLVDIIVTHKYPVYAPEKDDRHTAIKNLRVRIQQGKFKIHPRCRILRRQLEVGQWANEKHLDFERHLEDDELKHLDAIAAAIYFNRAIVTTRNPYPQNAGISPYTHFIPPEIRSPRDQQDEAAIASLLRV